jgi:hypothetical protein
MKMGSDYDKDRGGSPGNTGKNKGDMGGRGMMGDKRGSSSNSDGGLVGEKPSHTSHGGFMGKHHAAKHESMGSPFEGRGSRGSTRMEAKK